MARLPYEGWASLTIRQYPQAEQQALRKSYYSAEGRAKHYNQYVAYARKHGLHYDNPPDNYITHNQETWHTPALLGISILGGLAYFMAGLIRGTLGKK